MKEKYRLNYLNPLTYIFFALYFIATPFVCMFVKQTVQYTYKELFSVMTKGIGSPYDFVMKTRIVKLRNKSS